MRRVIKLEVEPNVREGAVARRIIVAAMQNDHANAAEVADVELATSELVTNAVEASHGLDVVSVFMELSEDDVCVSVANQGDRFEPNEAVSGADDLRGRGLAIVSAIGELKIRHDDRTTTVSVNIPLSKKQKK